MKRLTNTCENGYYVEGPVPSLGVLMRVATHLIY